MVNTCSDSHCSLNLPKNQDTVVLFCKLLPGDSGWSAHIADLEALRTKSERLGLAGLALDFTNLIDQHRCREGQG